MKKQTDYTILALAIPLLIAVAASGGFSCKSEKKKENVHSCKWEECPYIGITANDYQLRAECENGSDCYYFDSLHLEYPGESYDQLENRMLESKCPYEGLECPNAKSLVRDYQIEIDQDSIYLYDGERFVGAVKGESTGSLDSLMLKDNL